MSRLISAAVQAAIEAEHCTYAILVALDFADLPQYLFNGIGTVIYNGHTYIGAGQLGSIDKVSESSDLQPQNALKMTLSGIPGDMLTSAVNRADYFGRSARIDFLAYDAQQNSLTAIENAVWEGRMDTVTVNRDSGTASIDLVCEDRMSIWGDSPSLLYTHEHQQLLFPGDNGFDQVPYLSSKVVNWGGAPVTSAVTPEQPVHTVPQK